MALEILSQEVVIKFKKDTDYDYESSYNSKFEDKYLEQLCSSPLVHTGGKIMLDFNSPTLLRSPERST